MNQEIFSPSNKLEECLMRAATDSAARPEFYRLLMESDLFFLTPQIPQASGSKVLAEDTNITLVNYKGPDGPFLPFFSSLEKLRQLAANPGASYGYIALKGNAAFNIIKQNQISAILNPGSNCGKEFVPWEIRAMADGTFFSGNQHKVEAERKILLGQPKQRPQALLDVLARLFNQHSAVQAAYLTQMHDPESGEPPHLVIGIKCPSYMDVIAPQAAQMTREFMPPGEIVDFIEVGSGGESLDGYFLKQTKPFYQKEQTKPKWKFW